MAQRVLATLAALAASLVFAPQVSAGKAEIDKAVQRGISRLKEMQAGDGSWPTNPAGSTALVGLTLLECNVPATDPAIVRAATFLRNNWMDINDGYTTYALSLTILFFDRLGDPADKVIIQVLAARVLAGQNTSGGWTYGCPALSADEHRQLKKLLEQKTELRTPSQSPTSGTRRAREKVGWPKEIQHLFTRLQNRGARNARPDPGMGTGDNSNTQFAILGLWAARRHGVPVENALAKTLTRFRASQRSDGGWSYLVLPRPRGRFGLSTPSMTCAGLLGLVVGFASARETALRTDTKAKVDKPAPPPDLARDPLVRAGLIYVSNVVGQPLDPREGMGPGDMYYLLWSIERVAVAYSLPTFGDKDWYEWGSRLLLAAQGGDGGWYGRFGGDIDTSFALLFLRRVNLTRDLNAFMKGADALNVALKARPLPGNASLKTKDKNPKPGGESVADGRPESARPAIGKTSSPPKTETAHEPERPGPTRQPRGVEPKGRPAEHADARSPSAGLPAPANRLDGEAARLGAELLKAETGRPQDELLEKLKQGKGVAYTEVLAEAIPRLKGAVKTKARAALSERLARMTANTLREKLHADAAEIRRAAALACAMKEEKQFVPDLIALLEDGQQTVARAAHAALANLTGNDLGPAADARPEARAQAVAAWKDWWKKQ